MNALGQPVGPPLPGWAPPPRPSRTVLEGCHCRLAPLDAAIHAAALHDANSLDREGRMWTYLPYGPFGSIGEFRAWLDAREGSADPLFFTIMDRATGLACGLASYLRIEPAHGSIEIGHLQFSPRLQRTTAGTEAMYLMMKRVFELGYRRCEWKCDALNAASRRAADRLGFVFEGTFRQAVVYKGRSRDTAWYSVIDAEWPYLQAGFQRWLDPRNFDSAGRPIASLAGLRVRA